MNRFGTFAAICLLPPAVLANIIEIPTVPGWNELTFDKKIPNRFSLDDEGAIRISGDGSVSVLWRDLPNTAQEGLQLSWRWLVDAGPPATDLAKKGGDDRALSLYVSFEFDPERAGFWERSKRALLQPFVDDELPGRVLLYVWGGNDATDEWIDSPYFSGFGKMKILQTARSPNATWFDESVDLAADFRHAFGEEPTKPYQLAISSDGDDTQSGVQARVSAIEFNSQLLAELN